MTGAIKKMIIVFNYPSIIGHVIVISFFEANSLIQTGLRYLKEAEMTQNSGQLSSLDSSCISLLQETSSNQMVSTDRQESCSPWHDVGYTYVHEYSQEERIECGNNSPWPTPGGWTNAHSHRR